MHTSVSQQIFQRTHVYAAHGAKKNRRRQIKLLQHACAWIAMTHHLNHVDQIGKRHIIDFYRHNRDLSGSTIMAYFYAFVVLWEILGRSGEPPRPRKD